MAGVKDYHYKFAEFSHCSGVYFGLFLEYDLKRTSVKVHNHDWTYSVK
jgi:hypothetical protein